MRDLLLPIETSKALALDRSRELAARARRVIPGSSQTLSKGPTQYVQGASPVFLERGSGARVVDVDGNEYIDYPGALGPVVLGYSYPAVNRAIARQLEDGITFSLMHPLEVELAELLSARLAGARGEMGMVRFAKNGSDVTAAAVRLARALTGRELVARSGYHGSQDWFLASTSRAAGVPRALRELVRRFEYNDLDSLGRIFSEAGPPVAAVILEPLQSDGPTPGFLEGVVELAHRYGALVIFDEIKSGFRLAMGGAGEYFGVRPDLACYGKAIANGMPLAALVGPRELMRGFDQGGVFFSMTFGGEALSLAAAVATIRELESQPVFEHLWRQGDRLKAGFNGLAARAGLGQVVRCLGPEPKSAVVFEPAGPYSPLALKSLFQQEVIRRGVLFNGDHMLSYSHTAADIDRTLEVYEQALEALASHLGDETVLEAIDGTLLEAVFREI